MTTDNETPATTAEKTTGGNYFVANYPPFSFWDEASVSLVEAALDAPPAPGAPLGIYAHIPFCRKRCHFCYFKVYTGKSSSEIKDYLDTMLSEARLAAERAALRGRKPTFVYFGGGTPSYLSRSQLEYLFSGLQEIFPWDDVEEVTFECEPGTLSEKKLAFLQESGVTRLSLGVESFDGEILAQNNRAHNVKDIDKAYAIAARLGFPQINIDLIAGMLGETDERWKHSVERTLELAPDSVTIYQMEIPFNTTIFRNMRDSGALTAPVADWPTKRRWVGEAFDRLEAAGYRIGSAYTAIKESDTPTRFLYRDALWTGADLYALGVASFSHVSGHHFQNHRDVRAYGSAIADGRLPLARGLRLTDEERLLREFVLQLKLGRVEVARFRERFGVDIRERFAAQLSALAEEGLLAVREESVELAREGLLQVDFLLHRFFLDRHRNAPYV